MQPIEMFDISDLAAWSTWCVKNIDGGYGEAVLRYAAKWASLMDERIAKGDALPDIAETTSRKANEDGITGFMYGAAVSVLASCWKHGDELRRWHNLDTQIGDEGEKANESGGVLNPAILHISTPR